MLTGHSYFISFISSKPNVRKLLFIHYVCHRKGSEEWGSCNQSLIEECTFATIWLEKASEWDLQYCKFFLFLSWQGVGERREGGTDNTSSAEGVWGSQYVCTPQTAVMLMTRSIAGLLLWEPKSPWFKYASWRRCRETHLNLLEHPIYKL